MGFTTGKKVLTSYGINPVAQGAISGLHATLLEGALTRNIPWTNVFVPSPVAGGIDYTGVISVINLLNKMYGLNVDTTHLKKLSDDIQKRFTQEGAKRGGMFDTY
jgi:predicted ATP-grasp superfamily ATP-dependent carboligase